MRRSAFVFLLGVTSLSLSLACSTTPERWAVLTFERLSYQNLFEQVADTIDGSGYRIAKLDPSAGTLESDWQYGQAVREIRGPARRKVHAQLIAAKDGSFVVRVRVQEEVIRRGGLLATQIRQSEDWEEWKDDYDEAAYIAARLGALLQDYRVRAVVDDEAGPG